LKDCFERKTVNKNSEVAALHKFIMQDDDQQATSVLLDGIEEAAIENPEEFEALVEIVEGMKENELCDIWNKLLFATILVNLRYEPIKDFLLRVISDARKEIREDLDLTLWAATKLIAMSDERGLSFFEENFSKVEKNMVARTISTLYDCSEPHRSSAVGLKLLLKLADQYEKVENIIDRPAVEKQLEKFLEPNPFKRLWKKLAEKLDF